MEYNSSQPRNVFTSVFDWLPMVALVLLFSGFLFNRVVSNAGILLIGIYTITRISNVAWLFKHGLLISLIGISLLPLGYDIVLEKWTFFEERGIMKLVLVLFPVAIFCWKPDDKKRNIINLLILLTMLVSTAYSLFHYFMNFSSMAATYKVSKVMPTLSNSDHIRIGWVTVISIVIAVYSAFVTRNTIFRWTLSLYIVIQVIFLHLLGSKTGLITLYLTAVILIFYLLPAGKKWIFFVFIPIILSLPVVAYKVIPSLQERFHFIKYDFEHYSRGEYRQGLSDAVRYYSLLAGWDIIQENPVTGVGFSRLQSETEAWYRTHIPEMGKENYFLPSSEYMIYGASGGILGLLVFIFHATIPFLKRGLRQNIWFMTFFIPSAVSFLFETHLEGQQPLYAYAFFVAWFWYISYISDTEVKPDYSRVK